MKAVFLLFALFGCALAGVVQDRSILPPSSLNTQKLIERHGYTYEAHTVQTSDGYILEMHRIPRSKNDPLYKGVMFLQHGLLCSSSDWVLAGPDTGLGFILSNLGFDVWMGNARGNTYSRNHVSKSTLFPPFWTFSWHEIGLYDLTAMVDYVRWQTGEDQITYVGHSQGTTTFLLLNSMYPDFGSKIKSAHMLAPVAYMNNMANPAAPILAPMMGNTLAGLFGNMEFLPNNKGMEILGAVACRESSSISEVCTNTLFLLGGFHEENVNRTLLPEIMATTPAGCSANQVMHYLQEYNSGFYRQWDYGVTNKKHYGQKTPPSYFPENIRAPLWLYYSDNDYLSSPIDVHRLIDEINPAYLKGAYRVPDPKFTHIDFLWGLNVVEQVYNTLIENILNSL